MKDYIIKLLAREMCKDENFQIHVNELYIFPCFDGHYDFIRMNNVDLMGYHLVIQMRMKLNKFLRILKYLISDLLLTV